MPKTGDYHKPVERTTEEAFLPDCGRQFISQVKPGEDIDEVYYLRNIEQRMTRDGSPYLAMQLSDRTGTVEARAWHQAPAMASGLTSDIFVRVSGRAELYRGRIQLRVESALRTDAAGLDQRDFLPGSYRSRDELTGFLKYFLTEVYDTDYGRLLAAFFTDSDFLERFCLAPGDLRSHHAYLGGLLEHTISVTTLCQHTAIQHERLNSDLLMTAALLHDIGKVEEFSYEGRIRHSRCGRLLGHVVLGQRMIEQRLDRLAGFPEEKELALLHAVISHHGELEWGAPKRPQSPEALVLHHVDNLDARVKGFFEVVQGRGELEMKELKNYFRRPLTEPRSADREGTPRT